MFIPYILYTRGGQTFLLASQINKIKSIAGRKNFFWLVFLLFTPKTGHFNVFFLQNDAHSMHMHHYSLLQGPQKIFGGPHAARGPHFGHPWTRHFFTIYIYVVSGIENGPNLDSSRWGFDGVSTLSKSLVLDISTLN